MGIRMGSEVLQIGISEIGGTHVLRLTGELDSYTSPRLGAAAEKLFQTAKKVLVNLDALEFIDSSGLAALVGLWVDAKERGIPFLLSCRNPRVHRVLEITGLLNLFTIIGKDERSSPVIEADAAQGFERATPFADGTEADRESILSTPVIHHKRVGA